MQPIEALTELDKQRIYNYVHRYGSHRALPTNELVKYWNEEKQYLFDKFGQQLIVSIPIEYKISEDELRTQIYQKLLHSDNPHIQEFVNAFYALNNITHENPEQHCNYPTCLMNVEELGTNRLLSNGQYLLSDGKIYRVDVGTKTMKVIRKLAESYKLPYFEEFCNQHSLCLNQKTLKGELCLSIHPLDYITMSDNNYDWQTCMSWTGSGEYRQGTIEMMNSPCVVVGYLKGEQDWVFGYSQNDENTWNNKKWRSLFILDSDMALSIKNYPYANDYLTQEALKQLGRICGWGEVKTHEFEHAVSQTIEGHQVYIETDTGAMYNDFEAAKHYIALNPQASDICNCNYYYSGTAMCIECGCTYGIGESGEEHDLVCCGCDPRYECDCCGDRIYTNRSEHYWIDDETIVCRYCYEHELMTCPISEVQTFKSNTSKIWLKDKDTKTNKSYILVDWGVWNNCVQEWNRYFTIQTPKDEYDGWVHYSYIYNTDLTEEGVKLFETYGVRQTTSVSEDELPF